MAHILSIPENVMIQHLLPHLNHNDILRFRRVSSQTKAYADTYLWTPKTGHQGKCELKINSRREDQTLQAFLQLRLPPPSQLYIANEAEQGALGEGSFFEDDRLEEFMERYSKYVTHLRVDKLFLPFTSTKEIRFYESLTNLEFLSCNQIKTVGGAAQFEKKTINAEGSFLLRPTFKKLRSLNLGSTDCMDSMWSFINGVSDNLEEISHPFERTSGDGDSDSDSDDSEIINLIFTLLDPDPVRTLIQRHGLRNQSNLLYDWGRMGYVFVQPTELVSLFRLCRDNGVMIKSFPAKYLEFLFYDENGWVGENHRGNLFAGNIIHSLVNLHKNIFVMEFPVLTEMKFKCNTQIRMRHGQSEWPNLRKLSVMVDELSGNLLHFLCECTQRPKLEELHLNYKRNVTNVDLLKVPCARNLGNSCGNLKILKLQNCPGEDNFFLGLWDGLPLLEVVDLSNCRMLTNKGFVGNGERGSIPVFFKLEKLKHLIIQELVRMPGITDVAFRKVFRHLKLSRFELGSGGVVRSITLVGIQELLTGPLAETIEKLDLDGLRLENVSEQELKQVASRFRSSKML